MEVASSAGLSADARPKRRRHSARHRLFRKCAVGVLYPVTGVRLRNADRFGKGYIFQLSAQELVNWKSQFVTSNLSAEEVAGLKMGLRRAPYAFTERGLYMLATVLNSDRAVRATKAIIETYAQVRSMVRDMEALQTEKAGSPEQANMLTRAGHKLAELIGDNLSTMSRKTTIELNLALLKISHEVTQRKK